MENLIKYLEEKIIEYEGAKNFYDNPSSAYYKGKEALAKELLKLIKDKKFK